jgi:hypothetical protein
MTGSKLQMASLCFVATAAFLLLLRPYLSRSFGWTSLYRLSTTHDALDPLNHEIQDEQLPLHRKVFARQASSADAIIVKGAPLINPNGPLPLRLEIRELQQDTAAFNLYVLALARMQNSADQNLNESSYYGVSGKSLR